jgi:CheY-like chemotaxis protein
MPIKTKNPILLLVEDSDDDAFFFKRTLRKSGLKCSLRHVTNGAEAVDFLESVASSDRQKLPGVIFLDLKMPVLNGFEFLEWMRTQTFSSSIHVIVLSGSDYPEDKERAARLGATDYLVKPLKVEDFQRYLRDVCPREMGARV